MHAPRAAVASPIGDRGTAILAGRAFLIRYADDFVIDFSNQSDARRVMEVLARLEPEVEADHQRRALWNPDLGAA